MKSELLKSAVPTIDLVGLVQIPRELTELVEPGQEIPGHRRIYHELGLGKLPMIQHVRGRWYCPRPELPDLATALGLRLKRSGRPRASRSAASAA
jgi:hypothetical protein